jgi:hypothetical protein
MGRTSKTARAGLFPSFGQTSPEDFVMQSIGKQVEKFTLRGLWIALLSIVAMGMLAPRTFAQAAPQNNVVLSSPVSFYAGGAWLAGGTYSQDVPAGTSWGINSMGTIVGGTEYGGEVIQFTGGPSAYTASVVGSYGNGNAGPVAIDPSGNLWVSGEYSPAIAKIPMNTDGTYTITADATATGSTVPACTGTDTAECVVKELEGSAMGYYFGVESMAFDSAGDLFFATNDQGGNPYSIYECKAACLYGTTAPVLIFAEPSGTPQLFIGGMAFDSMNNLFFTDSAQVNHVNQESGYSDLNELVYDSANSAYDISNQVLVTETIATPGIYDEQISSVTVTAGASHNDTVYFGGTSGGIYAAPDASGVVNNFYGVANASGVKLILPDGNGNFYADVYNNTLGKDDLAFIGVGSATDPTITGVGQSTTFTVNASDSNSATCTATTPPSLGFGVTGTDPTAFDATAPAQGACGTTLAGTTFPVTVTFSPTAVGSDTAVLTATDSATTASGTANLSGTALKRQVISFGPASPLTYSSGMTIALTASGGASANPITFTLDSGPATFDSTVANQLDVSAPGTIVVTANQAGNGTYAPAPPVTKSIVVNPTPQSISWAPVPPRNVTTAASPITLNATGGASGNPVTFSVDGSSTCAGASITGVSLAFGTVTAPCTIVVDANQTGNADYADATEVQATIYVTAAPLPTGAPVILSQTTFLGALENGAGGGATAASNPDGGTMAIDPAGDAIIGTTYGNQVLAYNISNTNPGYQSVVAARDTTNNTGVNGVGTVAVDANGNLFVGNNYGGAPFVVKVPWNSTTMSYAPYTATPTTNCTGPTSDTAACLMPNIGVVVSGTITGEPLQSMAFDSHGNLFYAVQTDSSGAGTSGIDYEASLWECDAACLYAGTDQPVMLGEEPTVTTNGGVDSSDSAFTSLSPSTKVSQILGGLAVDSVGNLFFTDAAQDASNLIHYSDLYEWPVDSNNANGYATSPVTLLTSVPSAPSQYGANPIDAVAVDPTNGTVYFTNDQAIFAFNDSLTGPLDPTTVQSTMWTVSPQGGKYLAAAGNGVLYVANYSGDAGHDSMYYTTLGKVSVPGAVIDGQTGTVPGAAVIGTSTTPTTQMYTVLNDGNCTNPETVAYTSTAAEFTATQGASCNLTLTQASWFSTTLTFAPVSPDNGAITGTLTATDSASNTGTAAVAGTAQNLIPQTISAFAGITSPVSYGSGPYTLSATGGASGNPVVFSVDATSTAGVATVSGTNGTTLTITGVGTLVIDINQAGNSTYQAATQVQETITVNQATQAITFTTPSAATTSVVFGASPITLAATGGGSGNPVTFSLDASSTAGAGSLTGSALTITGVGTIVVDANQAGTADYSAAAQVQVSITVTQATQTITFTSPATSGTSVTYPGTATLAATGGASGNAVTFSLVSGGSVATLAGNVLTPTGTAFGAVVVAANQAGNSDYGAAATVQTTIVFAPIGTVATPAITPASGILYTNGEQGSTVSISISDSTANAAIYYTLNDGTPTLYSGPIPLAASDAPYTITATASELGYTPSSQATATYTVDNLAPNFTVTVSPFAVDLSPGTSAIVDITLSPNASFLGTVTFSCTGAPKGVTCAFQPATLTASSTNNITTVLTITDAATTSANRRGPNPFIPGGATFALALCFFGFRKRRSLLLGLVLLAGVFGLTQLTGCGSNAGNSSTGSTTTSMSVIATSTYNGSTITQTLPVTVTIRQ